MEHKKATFAVVCETLKRLPAIREAVAGARLLEAHPRLTPATAYVLAHEVMFGQARLPQPLCSATFLWAMHAGPRAVCSFMAGECCHAVYGGPTRLCTVRPTGALDSHQWA